MIQIEITRGRHLFRKTRSKAVLEKWKSVLIRNQIYCRINHDGGLHELFIQKSDIERAKDCMKYD